MSPYLLLFTAVAFEVLGTMLLPASKNFTKPLISFILLCSYAVSSYLISIVSSQLPLAIIYASWAGLGVFTVAVLSYFLYQQHLNAYVIFGLILVVVGVTMINVFKDH